jgi:hypothetical protein
LQDLRVPDVKAVFVEVVRTAWQQLGRDSGFSLTELGFYSFEDVVGY